MEVSIYEGRRYQPATFFKLMIAVNLLFAAVVLIAWPMIGNWLADPMAAASGGSLGPDGRPEVDDYPFLLLWLIPALAVFVGWLGWKAGMTSLAKFTVAFPSLLIALTCVWYQWMLGNFVIPGLQ